VVPRGVEAAWGCTVSNNEDPHYTIGNQRIIIEALVELLRKKYLEIDKAKDGQVFAELDTQRLLRECRSMLLEVRMSLLHRAPQMSRRVLELADKITTRLG
jgi:hypothetical protein